MQVPHQRRTQTFKTPRYQRALLKITGEALMGNGNQLDMNGAIRTLASEIRSTLRGFTPDLAIVIGGGNFIRGRDIKPFFGDQSKPDRMGMLATVINGIALDDALKKLDIETRHMSAVEVKEICEPYIQQRAIRHIEKGRVIILSGGTGNPNFTTDTAAIEKALDIGAKVVLKATKVGGVFSADPKIDPHAALFQEITYRDLLARELKILDQAAVGLASEKKMPIIVFNVFQKGNLKKIFSGQRVGTLISC